jgi:hypothetical protein
MSTTQTILLVMIALLPSVLVMALAVAGLLWRKFFDLPRPSYRSENLPANDNIRAEHAS